MCDKTIARVLESDAPLTATVHQRDIAHEVAKEHGWNNAALVGRTVTINRPRAELYAFWRDFRNLALFMENVESVTPSDGERSHWVVKAPAGKAVEWDSILTEEVENEVLAWESAEGADIKNAGRIEFCDGPPGRGTEVTATIVYEPPAATLES
ncbi:SRPBCC family protein [Caulobacter sp. DWP3-1-3b2]|uniref:SRPBCC family protein n=1 Tax=Caulobacter sp. DWP3-1-3b2 TaxID=2804643 RepID=UPI003CFA5173